MKMTKGQRRFKAPNYGRDCLLGCPMGSLLDLGRLRGGECLEPPHAIIPVNRQVFAGAIRSGGVEDQPSKELIARRDVGDDRGRVPRLA